MEPVIDTNTNTNTDTETFEQKVYQHLNGLTTAKMSHDKLILDGVCTRCAHCSMKLTDAVSIERGIGPVCSKKGYLNEPEVVSDEIQAMICLSEYPQLIRFLLDNYKEKGARGFMNGIVKVASLNKGNEDLHKACCDAVDALGFQRLANQLRESLWVIQLKESDGTLEVWIKRSSYSYKAYREIMSIPGTRLNRAISRIVVPVKDALTGALKTHHKGNVLVTNRHALWSIFTEYYGGQHGKVVGGTGFKIPTK